MTPDPFAALDRSRDRRVTDRRGPSPVAIAADAQPDIDLSRVSGVCHTDSYPVERYDVVAFTVAGGPDIAFRIPWDDQERLIFALGYLVNAVDGAFDRGYANPIPALARGTPTATEGL